MQFDKEIMSLKGVQMETCNRDPGELRSVPVGFSAPKQGICNIVWIPERILSFSPPAQTVVPEKLPKPKDRRIKLTPCWFSCSELYGVRT